MFKPGESGNEVTQFKEGESGNPNGRPKGSRNRSTIAKEVLQMKGILPSEIYEKLQTIFPEINENMTIEEIMTIAQVGKAISKQDTYAYQALLDSAYGKPKQETELTGAGGTPLIPDKPTINLIVKNPKRLRE